MSTRTVEFELATSGTDAAGRPARVPLTVRDDAVTPLGGEHMLVNLGPQHPATHGVLRLVVELEGETVRLVIPHIGYLHSGFEKLGEYRHYNQIVPLTDRTDYLSPMANNVGFALGAEKLMGIEVTERCRVLRAEVHQHVLGARVGPGHAERHPERAPRGVEAGGRELELDRAGRHSTSPWWPWASRSRMSSGR